jgi:crotonobetaine/carnitine-CoA ligase
VAADVWVSNGETMTVLAALRGRLESDPTSEYLDVNGEKVTAADVYDTACRVANALIAAGVRPGDRVASLIENSIECTLSWWGIVWAGAIAVPINTAYKGQYLRHQLHDSGAKVLVVQEDLADRLDGISAELPDLATPPHRWPARATSPGPSCSPATTPTPA